MIRLSIAVNMPRMHMSHIATYTIPMLIAHILSSGVCVWVGGCCVRVWRTLVCPLGLRSMRKYWTILAFTFRLLARVCLPDQVHLLELSVSALTYCDTLLFIQLWLDGNL